MYAGHKVEEASADDLFDLPLHPYTKGLLGSVPNLEVAAHIKARRGRLNEIKGIVPSLADLPQGCSFAPRCRFATEECRAISPPLEPTITFPFTTIGAIVIVSPRDRSPIVVRHSWLPVAASTAMV